MARKARHRLPASESVPAFIPPPVGLGRGAQPKTDQGERLSEPKASSSSLPFSASTTGCPVAQRRGPRPSGRLLFAYFLLAKQEKVSRPPGRDPACPKHSKRPDAQRSDVPPPRRPNALISIAAYAHCARAKGVFCHHSRASRGAAEQAHSDKKLYEILTLASWVIDTGRANLLST